MRLSSFAALGSRFDGPRPLLLAEISRKETNECLRRKPSRKMDLEISVKTAGSPVFEWAIDRPITGESGFPCHWVLTLRWTARSFRETKSQSPLVVRPT